MSSEHIDRKRVVLHAKRHKGLDNDDISLIISRCPLKAIDKQILTMILVDEHDVGFVGSMTGYSDSRVKARFAAALEVFCAVGTKMRLL